MKRLAIICCIITILIIVVGLCQPAINPDDYSGVWYSAEDQTVYIFQDGLIHCTKNQIATSDSSAVSGAYSYSKDSILLFASGINGLEKERELHLVQKGDGNFLCENRDGSGRIYFIRYYKK